MSSGTVPLNWYAVLLVVAAVSSWALTFPARHLAVHIGYVAQPDERKIHRRVTPESGGAAMFVAMLVTWAVAATVPGLDQLFHGSSEPLGLILGAAAIFVVGIIDDFRDMSAPAKVAGQVLAACILSFLGVTWYQFKIPLAGVVQLSPVWAPLLTSLWVIAITNAVNLIDGLDGLAAGVVAIASGALAVYGLHLQALGNLPADNIGPLIAIITCGICLGFLPHNFHPAKIFMGDAGALLLGLLMAASTMLIGGRWSDTGSTAARAGWPRTPGRPTSSSHPCSSPSSSSGSRCSTWPSRSSAGPPTVPASRPRTRTTSITGCSVSATGTAGACSSCGRGPRSLSGLILFPLYISSVNAFIPFGALALGVVLYTLFHPDLRKRPEPDAAAAEAGSGRPEPAAATVGSTTTTTTASTADRSRRRPGRGRRGERSGAGRAGLSDRRAARPAAAGGAPEKCERCVSGVLPQQVRWCDDAGRELQASRPRRGPDRSPDRSSQSNHCVIRTSIREAPTLPFA